MFPYKQLLLAVLVWAGLLSIGLAKSLYDPSNFKPLHADKKALYVGDAITILIFESTQATASAGEGSNGDFSFAGAANVDERNWRAGVNLGSSDAGDASTIRNGFVRAQITARVTALDEYGALQIEGSQQITINDEAQTIAISGKVRPDDISADNTVPSFRILDAAIAIDGEGSVSAGKNTNVFGRLAKWLGLQ